MELIWLEQAYTSLEKTIIRRAHLRRIGGRSAPCIPTVYDGAALLFRGGIVRCKTMLIY